MLKWEKHLVMSREMITFVVGLPGRRAGTSWQTGIKKADNISNCLRQLSTKKGGINMVFVDRVGFEPTKIP